MTFRNISIKVRLILAFGLVSVIFLVFAVFENGELKTMAALERDEVRMARETMDLLRMDSRMESINGLFAHALVGKDPEWARRMVSDAGKEVGADIERLKQFGAAYGKDAEVGVLVKAYSGLMDVLDNEMLPYLEAGEQDDARVEAMNKEIDAQFDAAMGGLDALIEHIDARLGKSQDTYSVTMEETRTATMVATGVSILVANIFALIIGLGITRPLKKTLAMALAVAGGDFSRELDVDQRDEVGQLSAAVASISTCLGAMQGRLMDSVRRIEVGELGYRASLEGFEGEFAQLLQSGNRVADTFLNYMHSIPLPIMTVNRDMDIVFLNKTAREVSGLADEAAYKGVKCYDTFKTSDCRTDSCACTSCMRSGRIEQSETDAHPLGLDLEIRYSGTPIKDENGKVVGAFEIIVDQTDIVGMQRKIRKLAEQASGISETLAEETTTLSAQVEQANHGAEVQNERTTETATAMEEMNATVLEVARNAGRAADNTAITREKAQEGARVVGEVADAVKDVQAQADALKADMAELGHKATGIGNIIEVISDIADQTNLLALNAAIEAARAGEAGRGFAVVADEVRKLAEKTMAATTEVNDAIRAIQESSASNVRAAERTAEVVATSTGLADHASAVLGEIVAYSDDSSEQVQSIAAASEEQSAAAEEITRATEEINSISGETSRSMQSAAQSVVLLRSMATELDDLIQQMVS